MCLTEILFSEGKTATIIVQPSRDQTNTLCFSFFFSTQELRLHPVKHLTGIDFYKMQVKLTFFLSSLYLFLVDVNDERNLECECYLIM